MLTSLSHRDLDLTRGKRIAEIQVILGTFDGDVVRK